MGLPLRVASKITTFLVSKRYLWKCHKSNLTFLSIKGVFVTCRLIFVLVPGNWLQSTAQLVEHLAASQWSWVGMQFCPDFFFFFQALFLQVVCVIFPYITCNVISSLSLQGAPLTIQKKDWNHLHWCSSFNSKVHWTDLEIACAVEPEN